MLTWLSKIFVGSDQIQCAECQKTGSKSKMYRRSGQYFCDENHCLDWTEAKQW